MQVCKSIGVANGEGNLVEVLDLEGKRKGLSRDENEHLFSSLFFEDGFIYLFLIEKIRGGKTGIDSNLEC